MNFFQAKKNILTHDGKFHADDVFAVALLSILYDGRLKIVRSRDPQILRRFLERGDIIVDTGRGYDATRNLFDHHQEGGAGRRSSGVPYAGFGLIWKHFGQQICQKEIDRLLRQNKNNFKKPMAEVGFFESGLDQAVAADFVWQDFDRYFVSKIDATDTGYNDYFSEKTGDSAYVPDSIVSEFVPDWTESYDSQADKNFAEMVGAAVVLIKRKIRNGFVLFLSKNLVEKVYQNSRDKRIIILEKGMPWKEVLIEKPEPLYVIFRAINNDGFMVQAVPVKKGSMQTRKPFPEKWRGQAAADLEKATGIVGAKFCHNSGFLAAAADLPAARQIAEISAAA